MSDNDTVLSSGFTHQDLVKPIKYLCKVHDMLNVGYDRDSIFFYNGYQYKISRIGFKGFQESPFEDGTRASTEYTITNIQTGERIHFSKLLLDMIEKYGFYEGKESPYRLAPQNIIHMFLPRTQLPPLI